MRAGLVVLSKSSKSLELRLDAGHVALDLLERQQRPLLRLAARIANHAGAAADERDRRVTGRAAAAPAPSSVSSDPTCRLDAVGSKPMYAVTRSLANASASPSVDVGHQPAPLQFVVTDSPSRPTGYYTSRWLSTRRAVLKTFAATGVGALTGTGVLRLRRTRAISSRSHAPMCRWRGLPAALAGLRIGLLTDIHRSAGSRTTMSTHAVTTLMSEQPDLIVLGGDYVTWRRSCSTSSRPPRR